VSTLSAKYYFLKYLALITSGICVASGFPGTQFSTLGIGALIPFSLIPLFIVIETLPRKVQTQSQLRPHEFNLTPEKRALHAFLAIWFFGFIVQIFAFFWITKPMIYFSSLKPYAAYPLALVICGATAIYFPFLFFPLILKTWISTRFHHKKLSLGALAMSAVLLEITLPRFFNWSFGSLMHSEISFNQITSVFGFHINSFFIFFTSLSFAHACVHFSKNKGLIISTTITNALIWGGLFCFGHFKLQNADKLLATAPYSRVAYVQPNFTFLSAASSAIPAQNPQQQNLGRLLEMSQEAIDKALQLDGKKPDLLVWPESAIDSLFLLDKNEIKITQQFSASVQVPILVQSVKWKQDEKKQETLVWSSSFLLRPDGSHSKSYDKWIPMPFGEHLPLEDLFPNLGKSYRKFFENASKIEIGTSYEALAYNNNEFVAPLICFDSISQRLPRLQSLKGKASLFVNQANFVWMVDSNAGLEFSVLNQFRAIENTRSLVMVSNTGPTMAFDPYGRILLQPTALLTQSTGFVDVPLVKETTTYTKLENWPLLILGLMSWGKIALSLRNSKKT
jgi:apolipoprotein N-acyltransferase